MNLPTIEQMLDFGVHFGHRASRWNPKMKPFIFTTRNKIHVIDLEKTQEKLQKAAEYVKGVVSHGGTILFVGTKRQAKQIVKEAAKRCAMPYVVERWLGGTFTNFKTIQKTIQKLKKLQQIRDSDDFEIKYVKKERLIIEREIIKLENLFEGIKDMKELPESVFTVDVNHEKIVVREAKKVGIKVIALIDTNSDPGMVDYPIPSNDDAIKAINLIVNFISDAVLEGKEELAEAKPENNDKADKKS